MSNKKVDHPGKLSIYASATIIGNIEAESRFIWHPGTQDVWKKHEKVGGSG